MKHVIFRTGTRVKLAVLTTDYVDLLMRWFNDPEVNRFLGRDSPMYPLAEKEFIENLRKKDASDQVFVVLARVNRRWQPIGLMGLHHINHLHGTATTGAVIGEKKFWGGGYGSEAKILLLEYAFNRLNLRKISSLVYGFNARSRAYSERCGYTVEGVQRAHRYRDGAYHDEVILALFREDFDPVFKFYTEHGRAPHREELAKQN